MHRFRDKAIGKGCWEFKEIAVCACVCVLVGSEWEGGPYVYKGGGNIRAVQQSA